MNLRWATGLALAALSAVAISTLAPITALADPGDGLSIVDGVTAPAFSYTDAIRERVYIPVAGVDQDQDGHDDTTVIDIIRPAESDGTLKVPAIIDPSPYYTTIGRGNENEKIADLDHDGLNDVWPTFYDNYFVPRGYAVILAHMDGTGFSDGCPMHGGPGDIESMKVVVDWLQGRVAGHDAANHPVVADWDNGKAAMIGKSYDGTLANGVAATGVVGLTTIVPIDAISDWYRYSRTGGVRFSSTNYPAGLARTVTNDDRRDLCATTRDMLNLMDGDETGDVNAFWQARDYLLNVDKVTASVFAVHGLNDDNVMMDQLGPYWDALTQRDIPRKLWLAKTGHVDPFDYRREVWVDTLHRWFDYWLQGVDNGIMDEPMATVENAPDVFEDYANWPIPGTQDVDVYLAGETGVAGSLALQPSTTPTEATFTGAGSPYNESALMGDRDIVKNGRLVFLSEPLQTDLRLSGTPRIELTASLDKTYSNLTALLVDYGTSTRTTRSGEGIHDLTTSTCWGEASTHDDACYLEVAHTLVSSTTDTWRVTRGTLDSRNRDSLVEGAASDVVPGDDYGFSWPLEPYDQVFAAGHRIGVVLTTNLSGYQSSPAASVTVDTAVSRIVLPVVGGLAAADHSAAFGAAAPVALSFDLGGHGTAIPDQAVAYDTAPVEPTVPTEAGWVFQGWYTDATYSTAFDFDAELTSDATAFAAWASLEDVVDTLQIVASDLTVKQGKSITVSVEGFDASGGSLGDVTDFADLTSSVDSDVILGNKITFVHASPHVITATLGGASAAVTVEVSPPVVNPAELGSTGADFAQSFALLALLLFVTGGLFLLGRRLHRRA